MEDVRELVPRTPPEGFLTWAAAALGGELDTHGFLYEVEWVELFMDLTYEKLPGLGYLEPTSTLVQVTWNEETELWELPDDDFWSLDTLIIDYNF